jgi:methylmalonyl-CoA mutase N-terminal domain/subunit
VEAKLKGVEEAAVADVNLMPPMKEALASGATIGEVSDALRRVFGVHRPNG